MPTTDTPRRDPDTMKRRKPTSRATMAARAAMRRNTVRLPGLPIELPGRDQIIYLGGIGALLVVGALEWPVAAVLGVGHLLAARRSQKLVADFGEAFEDA